MRVSEQVKHAVDTELNRLGNPYNKNQQDALFTFNLFELLTCTCFEQAYCSSSGGTALYIQKFVYVMRLC